MTILTTDVLVDGNGNFLSVVKPAKPVKIKRSRPARRKGLDRVPAEPGVIGVIFEVDLARQTGISQKTLRTIRAKLPSPGRDWYHDGIGNFCRVKWTDSGLVHLRPYLDELSMARLNLTAPEIESMLIVRSGFANPRIIQCRRSCGQIVNVRVKDSQNYTPFDHKGKPMQVRARPTGDGWVVEGRAPRWRGRY